MKRCKGQARMCGVRFEGEPLICRRFQELADQAYQASLRRGRKALLQLTAMAAALAPP